MQWRLFQLILMAQCSFLVCQLYKYHFIEENKTWDEAQSYCRENYTDLATVPDKNYMKRLSESAQIPGKDAWIGLYSTFGKSSRVWHWSLPGVEFNETNWGSGEEGDLGNTLENCVLMDNDGKWIGVDCQKKQQQSICYNDKNTSEKTFHLIEEIKTWREAQRCCREEHTDLVSGMKQLNSELLNLTKPKGQQWIGLFRDTWRWSDGSNSSYRHWESVSELEEEFNKTDPISRKCATTLSDKSGKWSSDDCDKTKPFFCYDDKLILIKSKKNWTDALDYCRKNHHDLVAITSAEKQKLVQEKAKAAETPDIWLGMRYSCFLDLWFWVNDKPVCYKNWVDEDCSDECHFAVAMNREGKWLKKADDEILNFICSTQ